MKKENDWDEINQEEIEHLQSKYALDEHFSKKENSLSDEIHKEFGRFQTPTYNFKHLRNLELKVDKDIKEFIKKTEEKKNFNVDDAVRLLNDKANPNYWIIELMWKFGRYQKYLQLKELAGKDLIENGKRK